VASELTYWLPVKDLPDGHSARTLPLHLVDLEEIRVRHTTTGGYRTLAMRCL
jgi:hypothetical protein